MSEFSNPIPVIQDAKHNSRLLYHGHALQRMIGRGISIKQVEQALNSSEAEVLRNYPQAGRSSPECLIMGKEEGGRYLHILVAYPQIEVITSYEPTSPKWKNPRERGQL